MSTPMNNSHSDNQSNSGVAKPPRVSISKRIAQGFKRYWFVAVPAIMLNVGITLDHVMAKNNENAFRIRIREAVLEASLVQDDDTLSDTLQAHWITTNDDGNLEGRISAIESSDPSSVPIEQLDVALLKKGEKIRKATTNSDGKFILEDVNAGVYTLVAAGQNGFLAYGVNVLSSNRKTGELDGNTKLDTPELKRAYYVSHSNLPQENVVGEIVVQESVVQESVVQESLQIDAAAVPPEFRTLQRISKRFLPAATAFAIGRDQDDAKVIGKASDVRSGFQHALTKDGHLEGRIQPMSSADGESPELSEMNIFLIQNDIEAARVAVEKNGKFKIEDVDPGIYSLVAAGVDGFAALSLELVELEKDDTQTSVDGKTKAHYVSHRANEPNAAGQLGIAIVTDADDLKAIGDEIDRIADERNQLLAQQDPVNQFADQGGFAPDAFPGQGGFPGDGGFVGDGGFPGGNFDSFTPSGPSGLSSPGRGPRFIGGQRRGGAIAALIALSLGITALATDDNSVSNPPAMTRVSPIP